MTAQEKLAMIQQGLTWGATVYVTTYTRAIRITPKTARKWEAARLPLFKVQGDSLYLARGKHFDCIDYAGITIQKE